MSNRTSAALLAAAAIAITTPVAASEVEMQGSQAGPTATAETASAPPAGPTGSIARAQVTTHLLEREPQDSVETLPNDTVQVFFFTEVRGMAGGTLTHRWEWNDQVMAEVPLGIGASRWRTHSSKNLAPEWLGEWKVSALDENGNVLAMHRFTYVEAATPAPASATAPETAGTQPPAAPRF